ncbi:MAG: T9SS type A sorting domain-containing protein [Bacteroidia bacterium]|nr:T9SS type A sorting domain-containing protein [Bacteroidia bacterium]
MRKLALIVVLIIPLSFIAKAQQPCPDVPYLEYGGQIYNTVQIGAQCWMKENLNIGTFVQSTASSVAHSNVTNNGIIEKYGYGNDSNYCAIYGGLYDWNEAMGYSTSESAQGICPAGWHIPSAGEWDILVNSLGGENSAGCNMKEAGTVHWADPNFCADNSSGFTALPGAMRRFTGTFFDIDSSALFWTSTQSGSVNAKVRYLDYSVSFARNDSAKKVYGFSVRCIKDDSGTGSLKNENKSYIDIFPNPSNGIINIKYTLNKATNLLIQISTLNGEIIYSEQHNQYIGEFRKSIDLKGQPKACYLIKIITNEDIYTMQIILK